MRFVRLCACLCLAVSVGIAARAGAGETVTVYAAASTQTALEEIAAGFAQATGHRAVVSAAGTPVLARQIQRGAPADVFVSASPAWMDTLDAEGHIAPGTRRDLVGNRLVLIGATGAAPVPLGPAFDLAARLGGGRLAVALIDAVPAGQYARAALEATGLWEAAAPRLAQTDNVRAALALVALGAAPLGVVYASDARAEPRVTVVAAFPEDSHPPIVYPVAAVVGRDSPAVRAFLAHLSAPEARAAWARHGFRVLGGAE
ncbi:molybdate ABC transporter substrate-binding protein [Rhodobacteraceae bacterium CCMM004]|nr:molybdate ABC transporter substrate-binding protein [Rhodobacteraceae bacterium CCMM004]